jgi:hypothetical protein
VTIIPQQPLPEGAAVTSPVTTGIVPNPDPTTLTAAESAVDAAFAPAASGVSQQNLVNFCVKQLDQLKALDDKLNDLKTTMALLDMARDREIEAVTRLAFRRARSTSWIFLSIAASAAITALAIDLIIRTAH